MYNTVLILIQYCICIMYCPTLRAELCSPTHTQHCATHASLSQGHIGARRRAAKPQDSSRQRIDYYYGRLRQSRDYRGRRGAQDASVDATRAHARVRAGLVLARPRLAQQFSGRVCHRGPGPAFRGRRRGRPAQARSHQLSVARAHAIALDRLAARDVAHGGVGFWSTAGAIFSRAGTARVVGRWVEVTRAVCSHSRVVCELA